MDDSGCIRLLFAKQPSTELASQAIAETTLCLVSHLRDAFHFTQRAAEPLQFLLRGQRLIPFAASCRIFERAQDCRPWD
jgi:hypothetical protein